eukprot:TRINITY_DN11097_c1_g1_i2.p1 TRINITY_DN11097_c1_g1~~TRINITY_DN11097_c1_g1_i2.p1  ORF type:complete len:1004 (+),score=188.44 TRINITY_DN11097_c1_g1_i2:113-3124(+)
MSSLGIPTNIASGELYLLNGSTGGELRPLPFFLNKNFKVLAANLDRAYVACEPPVCPEDCERPPCSVYCFRGGDSEPFHLCQEFEAVDAPIKQIAIGSQHELVLTTDGVLYSRGVAIYGSTGHGGARDVPEFRPVPALQGKKVKFVSAGPNFSIAITAEGDVYSWGKAFQGETGLFSQVEAVPRFAAAVTPFRVLEVSCGHGHVIARTESQQCITWGENTCGQLGLGQKSKPTYKPQLLDCIPSQVANVSAGWAHSIAVGTDGRVYSWGLNSHGQLGLGDTKTRHAPHLMHSLVRSHEVESAHAARAFTILRTSAHRAMLCGQIPKDPNGDPATMEFIPRRPGNHDPEGCILAPVLLILSNSLHGSSAAQLSEIIAFDRGAIGFARSTVYKITPNVAPLSGGTKVRAMVTGLPYEFPKPLQSQSLTASQILVQDSMPVQVRLKSASPNFDMIVKGVVVEKDTIEFISPDAGISPLGAVVVQGSTLPVQVRVSVDDGFTWTPDRYVPPSQKDLDRTFGMTSQAALGRSQSAAGMQAGLQEFKDDFSVKRVATTMASEGSTMLWYCEWPAEGPSHIEPNCAPVCGGTEILLHVPLPARMPTENLTVKFVCTPLSSIGDAELEGKAPMRRDAAEITNPDADAVSQLALAGSLEVPVVAFLDPAYRGVRCVSPPIDGDLVHYYKYSVQLSLDGVNYLPRELPFNVFNLHVTGLEPLLGPLSESSTVKIKTTGLVETDILKVRIDFPLELEWASRVLPAFINHTTGEISFAMPDLQAEVRQRVDEARAALPAPTEGEDGAEASPVEEAAIDLSGGLAGSEVFVELSLNGQNFTEDRIKFTYHGPITPGAVKVIPGEGEAEAAPVDAKKGKKGAAEEPAEVGATPGCKLGCPIAGAPSAQSPLAGSASAAIRAEVVAGEGDAAEVLQVVDLAAILESLVPPGAPAGEEPPAPVDMVTAQAPSIRTEDVPEGSPLFLRNFQVSLNGQCFTPCPEQSPMRLEPVPPSPKPE